VTEIRGWRIDDRKEFLLIATISILVVLGLSKLRPRNQVVLVARTRGDIYSSLRPQTWDPGEVRRCEFAAWTDERGHLLLCGNSVQQAWGQTWIRKDIKDRIYAIAEQRQVYFQSAGQSVGRHRVQWSCVRDSDSLTCK
jgi:hypothetical protein